MIRNYERGAKQSIANERRRRQAVAPLLDAAGVLPPLPTIDELVARRKAVDATFSAEPRPDAAKPYREAIERQLGPEALDAMLDRFHALRWVPKSPAYEADYLNDHLARALGKTKLEIFEMVRSGAL